MFSAHSEGVTGPMNAPESRNAHGRETQPIEIRRLQIFAHAARSLCFATSAQALHLTPSAVSHAIRALEDELSCVLFARHGPKISLSKVGRRLLPIAEDLLGRAGDLRREVSLFDDEASRLRIRVPEFLSASLLSRVLPSFFECFPSFEIGILISDSPSREDDSDSPGTADLWLGFDDATSDDLVRRDLVRGRFGLFVAPFHPLAAAQHLEPKELTKHRLLVPHSAILRKLIESGLAADGEDAHIWLLPSHESVRELARVGLGIAVIGVTSAAPAVEAGILKSLSYSGPPLEVTCSAFWSPDSQLPWAAEVFLSFVEMAEGF
jgi:DNA-binding transcriptional LysR family regulator